MIPAMRPVSQEEGRGDMAGISSYCGKYIKAALNNSVFKCLHCEFTAVNVMTWLCLSARVIKVFWPQIILAIPVKLRSSKTCAT